MYQPQIVNNVSKKLLTHWDGPYVVSRMSSHSDKSYFLATEDGVELKRSFSVLYMAPWRERPDSNDEAESFSDIDSTEESADPDGLNAPIKDNRMRMISIIPKGEVRRATLLPKVAAIRVQLLEM